MSLLNKAIEGKIPVYFVLAHGKDYSPTSQTVTSVPKNKLLILPVDIGDMLTYEAAEELAKKLSSKVKLSQFLRTIPTNSAFDSQRELASREISLRYHCASNVCSSNKYRPPVYQDVEGLGLCNFQLNICASDVNVGESINSKYFRDCSINQMDFVDLDSVYGQDQGVQALLGLRTGENAALIAAKNKQLQLALRAEEREAEANRQAELDAGVTDELNAIQAVSEEYERQKDTKMKFIIIGILFLLLVVVAILNL